MTAKHVCKNVQHMLKETIILACTHSENKLHGDRCHQPLIVAAVFKYVQVNIRMCPKIKICFFGGVFF